MGKNIKLCLSFLLSICFLFLTACSSVEETAKENLDEVLDAVFTIDKDVFDIESETWQESYEEYFENAETICEKASAKEGYMSDKLAVYTPILVISNRTTSEFKRVEIVENEAAVTSNYKDYIITVYVDCTYSDKDKACEVISGDISIDENGKITYFNLEM